MKHNDWIIVKVTESHIVLMNSEGSFKNVKRPHNHIPLIGERLNIDEPSPHRSYLKWTKVVAIAACLLVLSFFALDQLRINDPQVAYVVALDINPSLEVYTDKELKIIKLAALNQDGKKIIENVDSTGKSFAEILDSIIGQCIRYGYLNKKEKGLIVMSVIPTLEDKELREVEIKTLVSDSLTKSQVSADVNIALADQETLEKAHKLDISVNKYKLYDVMKGKGIPLTIDEARSKSIRNMMEMVSDQPNKFNRNDGLRQNKLNITDIPDIPDLPEIPLGNLKSIENIKNEKIKRGKPIATPDDAEESDIERQNRNVNQDSRFNEEGKGNVNHDAFIDAPNTDISNEPVDSPTNKEEMGNTDIIETLPRRNP